MNNKNNNIGVRKYDRNLVTGHTQRIIIAVYEVQQNTEVNDSNIVAYL
jgi:hypothetical protein